MAPEQAAGRVSSLDPATDVYGLGAILYAMLTGRPPFVAGTVMETIVQVTEREPVPPRRLRPDVPLDLQRICLKCLEKDAAARYATAAALAEDLERFLKKEPVEARHVGVLGRLRRWARREPELVYRVLGIGMSALLTQLNYAFAIGQSERIPALHYRVVGVEMAWIAAIILLHLATRFWPGRLATAWILLDVGALTTLLSLLEGIESALVLAYPLLIAVSGLWSSVGLVWLATIASMGGYFLLWRASAARQEIAKPHYVDVVLATLLVTGAVVAHQVRRVRALSRFYEHKL
jgi:serine/threonine-protein kinase